MDRHPVVLQQRIEVLPFGGNRGEHIEGARDEIQHQEEEDRETGKDRERVRSEIGVAAAMLERNDRGENRQQPGPQQERSLLAAP